MRHKRCKHYKVLYKLNLCAIVIVKFNLCTGAVRLDGDVITANGSILNLGQRIDHNAYYPELQEVDPTEYDGDSSSMFSCSCGCIRASRQRQ